MFYHVHGRTRGAGSANPYRAYEFTRIVYHFCATHATNGAGSVYLFRVPRFKPPFCWGLGC